MRRVIGILGALVLSPARCGSSLGGVEQRARPRNQYWVELDNAFGLVNGGDLKIAGVRAGKITKLKLDKKTNRALVGIQIDKTRLRRPARRHALRRAPAVADRRVLHRLPAGHVAACTCSGGAVIPVTHTSSTVAPDLVNDVLRKPYRERFSIIINELGAAVAGNGQNLNDAIRRASPALRETDKVLGILANQNKVLGDLVQNGDTVVNDLANNKHNVAALGHRGARHREGLRRAPGRRWPRASASCPGFLRAAAPDDGRARRRRRPADAGAGEAQRQRRPAHAPVQQPRPVRGRQPPGVQGARQGVEDRRQGGQGGAGPVVSQLNTFSTQTPELAKNLAIVLQHLDSRNHAVEKDPRSPGGQGYTGLEALLEYTTTRACRSTPTTRTRTC